MKIFQTIGRAAVILLAAVIIGLATNGIVGSVSSSDSAAMSDRPAMTQDMSARPQHDESAGGFNAGGLMALGLGVAKMGLIVLPFAMYNALDLKRNKVKPAMTNQH
jgi:hypothetical protein